MAKLLLPCAESIVTQWIHFSQQASVFRTIVNLLTAKMKATPPRTGTAYFLNCNAVTPGVRADIIHLNGISMINCVIQIVTCKGSLFFSCDYVYSNNYV